MFLAAGASALTVRVSNPLFQRLLLPKGDRLVVQCARTPRRARHKRAPSAMQAAAAAVRIVVVIIVVAGGARVPVAPAALAAWVVEEDRGLPRIGRKQHRHDTTAGATKAAAEAQPSLSPDSAAAYKRRGGSAARRQRGHRSSPPVHALSGGRTVVVVVVAVIRRGAREG